MQDGKLHCRPNCLAVAGRKATENTAKKAYRSKPSVMATGCDTSGTGAGASPAREAVSVILPSTKVERSATR